MHASSAEVSQQWQRSARQALHNKFEEVASLHQFMQECERAGQEQKNLQALLGWSFELSSMGLIGCIQVLSEPLHELPSLVGPAGRFQRVLDEFISWTSRVEAIWSARLGFTTGDSGLESIEGLGGLWQGETATLAQKVTSFARDLDKLRQPSSGTSIASIVDTCKALLRGLSDELHIMQEIESDVVSKEERWVESRLQTIARDAGYHPVEVDRETASWRI
jgi:hypothetical protein